MKKSKKKKYKKDKESKESTRSKKLYVIALGLIGLLILSVLFYFYTTKQPLQHTTPVDTKTVFQIGPVASTSTDAIRIPIFIYHSVRPDYPGQTKTDKQFTVTPELFEQQLKYLQDNGYTVISMDQLTVDIQNATTSGVKKPVVLTFDDGWKNQYTYAFPLLLKYHDTATFFIYTHPILTQNAHYMTWDEVKALDAAGMTIGSHTLTHPYLSKLTPEQLHAEVFDSKKILEQHLGKPVVHFASPFGYTSPEIVALLAQAGYTTGRTTYKGAYHSKNDRLQLTGFLVNRTLSNFTWTLRFSS